MMRPMTNPPRATRTLALHVVLALVLALATSCGDDAETSGPSPAPTGAVGSDDSDDDRSDDDPDGDVGAVEVPEVRATQVAELAAPIALLPRPGDDRLWVAERAGTIWRLEKRDDGTLEPDGDPVLDLTDLTTTDSERGVLGMAFSPDGAVLYVSHTDADGDSVVAVYDIVDHEIDPDSREVLLTQEQPYPNHNGGHVVTTSDATLWLGLGDGGASDDPENRAQDPDTLLGKLIRVDTTGDEEHEVVASGLRNPWRFSFDADGSIWIADVGQNQVEEINHVASADLSDANFGWSGYEGDQPYLEGDGRRPDDPTMPVFTYARDDGNCSITGGFTYVGDRIPSLRGSYLFTDYCNGRVRALTDAGDGELRSMELAVEVDRPISFGTDADGDAYVLSEAGPIVRLDAA